MLGNSPISSNPLSSLLSEAAATLTVAATGAAALIRGPAHTILTSGVGAATVATLRVVLQLIAAAGIGLAAALIRRPNKALTVAGTGTPVFSRFISRLILWSGVGTAAIGKRPPLSLSASGIGLGSLSRQPIKLLAALAVGSVGTLIKSVGKSLRPTGIGTPLLAKRPSKTLLAVGVGVATIVNLAQQLLRALRAILGIVTPSASLSVTQGPAASLRVDEVTVTFTVIQSER